MSSYPILVRRFRGDQSMLIVCERCGLEDVLRVDEILNDAMYACPAGGGCPGPATYKYDEGDVCPGCNRLGRFSVDGYERRYCSRSCKLQWEYAQQLKKGAA